MIDQNSQFFALLTKAGEAKQANADALGVPWGFSFMGVGDANGTEPMPDRLQTQLINEQYKAPINQVRVSPSDSSIIITELVIPPEVGGWWIREIGLYDIDGDLVAVANCAPSFKPLLDQGSGKTQIVRMNFVVRSSGNIALKIDPTVVLATRDYVDNAIIEALPRTTVAGTFTQVRVNDRGLVEEGSNPSTLGEYGITDAHTKVETEALIGEAVAPLANKADKADTLAGYGITDAHTKVETEALIGEAVAPLAGKADKADTLAGYGITDAHTKVETEALIGEAVAPLAGKADKADTLAGYGITDAHTKVETEALIGEAVAPLAGKADKADTLAGYGITDAHTKVETEALIGEAVAPLAGKADKADTLAGYGITDAHTKVETEALIGEAVAPLAGKADKADTLAGYGITDAHTKVETEALIGEAVAPLAGKADKADTLAGYGITDAHTKVETEALIGEAVAPLANKADRADTLAGYGITDAHTKMETEALIGEAIAPLAGKADKADTLAGYGIIDTYNKAEVDSLVDKGGPELDSKFDKAGGLISGPVTIKALAAADGDFTPALSITSEEGTPGVSTSFEMRNYEYSTHFLAHATYLMVMLENHASPESWNWQPCPIFAGDVYSNNSLVHTHVTFSKPSASGWIAVNGATTLPNGGVWAYSVSWSGSDSDGASANIVPGGSTIGKEGAVGFAWRIGF